MTTTIMTDRTKIGKAMESVDTWVIEFDYVSASGHETHRVASPVRWTRDRRSFIAICLGRETCRTFTLERCSNVTLRKAIDFVMPVDIIERMKGLE